MPSSPDAAYSLAKLAARRLRAAPGEVHFTEECLSGAELLDRPVCEKHGQRCKVLTPPDMPKATVLTVVFDDEQDLIGELIAPRQ